jgi:hypothetical protein
VIGFNPKPNLKPKANFIFKKTQATKKSYPWPPRKKTFTNPFTHPKNKNYQDDLLIAKHEFSMQTHLSHNVY